MKRVVLTLGLAAAIGLMLNVDAKAMTASQGMAFQAVQQVIAHPGHLYGWRHGHHWGPHRPPFYRPVYGPYAPPPVILYGPNPYYGYPGGIVIRGRGWGLGIAL